MSRILMGTEIERKFLVTDDGWRLRVQTGVRFRQGYLATTERCSVRVRVGGGQAKLNIKSATLGIQRLEFEYEIPITDAEEMLDRLGAGRLVEKTRYLVDACGHVWEVDVFEGANLGLVLAEVELKRVDESVVLPAWVGGEVSDDERYYNSSLAIHPFNTWHD